MRLSLPLAIAGHELRNRIVFGAHVNSLGDEAGAEPDIARCLPGDRACAYYARRAEGGAALIVAEEIPVTPEAFRFRAAADPGLDGFEEGLSRIAGACHGRGALVLARLSHPGAFADFDLSFRPALSPSGLATPAGFHASQVMEGARIESVADAFARLAGRVVGAGFDGVEIDAGPLSLIEQFLAPALNLRSDEWSAAQGAERLVRTIVERTRAAIGPGRLLIVHLTATPDPAIGIGMKERAAWIERIDRLEEIDILHLSRGTYSSIGTYGDEPDDGFEVLDLLPARLHPRMLGGGILSAERAETLLAGDRADLVALVRTLIADPDFPRHAARAEPELARPCIACNQNCRERVSRNYSLTCLVNAAAGREDRSVPTIARHPTDVTVIGGGPAGMEAALTAARRGHRVRLFERGDRLGGQMLQIARQPMRHRFADLVAWYEKQMRLCQVELVFGAELAAGDVPDAGALVVATGAIPDRLVRHRSAPYQPGLPGHDRGHVAPVEDVLSGILKPEGRIVLLDDCDDWKSLGTALFLARAGHEVHLVTRQATLGARLAASGQLGLVRKQFAELGIRVHAGSQVLSWSGDGVELMDLNSKEHLSMASDWLVTATTSRANSGLSEALTRSGRPHFLVGDCAAPRNLGDAVREGRTVAGGIEGNEA